LALDEPKESDDVYDIDEFKFVVDKELMNQARPIKIDMNYFGFVVSSSLKLEGGCSGGSCSTC